MLNLITSRLPKAELEVALLRRGIGLISNFGCFDEECESKYKAESFEYFFLEQGRAGQVVRRKLALYPDTDKYEATCSN